MCIFVSIIESFKREKESLILISTKKLIFSLKITYGSEIAGKSNYTKILNKMEKRLEFQSISGGFLLKLVSVDGFLVSRE